LSRVAIIATICLGLTTAVAQQQDTATGTAAAPHLADLFGWVSYATTTGAIVVTVALIAGAIKLWKQRNETHEIDVGEENKVSRKGGVARPLTLIEQQYALFRAYHAQGLDQSKISFWFSLGFASLGFLVIIMGVFLLLGESAQAAKAPFTLASGTIIDAVAALFFIQSNRARRLMTEFFDRLRIDRKLDESLRLAKEIEDENIQAVLKSILALNFAEVDSPLAVLSYIRGHSPSPAADPLATETAGVLMPPETG